MTPDIQHNSILHIDDKDIGWSPISNDNGRIFVNARKWTSRDIQENKLTYEQAEDFLRFLDKYVSRAMGTHFISRWSKSNCTKTILDKITASDIAYTILVYENSKEVWEEELEIRGSAMPDYEKRTAIRHKKPKYHEGRGKRLRIGDGWTDGRREYYKELLGTIQSLKFSTEWNTIEDHWKMYQMKHYKKGDTRQDENLSRHDEGSEEESDESDWRIEMVDDVEFDGIDDGLSNNDGSEPP